MNAEDARKAQIAAAEALPGLISQPLPLVSWHLSRHKPRHLSGTLPSGADHVDYDDAMLISHLNLWARFLGHDGEPERRKNDQFTSLTVRGEYEGALVEVWCAVERKETNEEAT